MLPAGYCNLNGALLPNAEARVSLFDHGLLYGDGFFETLRVYDERFFRLGAHLQRLSEAAARTELSLPWTEQQLADAIRETVAANGVQDGAVRLTVTRGAGPPLPDPSLCDEPTFFVTVRPSAPPDDAAFERGVTACFAGPHPQLAIPGIKSLCYWPFQRARQEARRRGFDEGLLTRSEFVVEASASNIFIAAEGALATPDLASGCLPGVTREAVLELARRLDIPCRETAASTGALSTWEEVFLTNSQVEIMPVVRVEALAIGNGAPGPLTRRLRVAYRELVRDELAP